MNRLLFFFTRPCSVPEIMEEDDDKKSEDIQVKAFLQVLDLLDDAAVLLDTIFEKLLEVAKKFGPKSVEESVAVLNREVKSLDKETKISLLLRMRSYMKRCGLAAISVTSDMFAIASRGHYVKEASGVVRSLISNANLQNETNNEALQKSKCCNQVQKLSNRVKLQRSASSVSKNDAVFERLCKRNH